MTAVLMPKSASVRMEIMLVKTPLMPEYSTPSDEMKIFCVTNPSMAVMTFRIMPLMAVFADATFLFIRLLYHLALVGS